MQSTGDDPDRVILDHNNAVTHVRHQIPPTNCGRPRLCRGHQWAASTELIVRAGAMAASRAQAGARKRLRRRALVTTLTLDKAIARAANIGESSRPMKG